MIWHNYIEGFLLFPSPTIRVAENQHAYLITSAITSTNRRYNGNTSFLWESRDFLTIFSISALEVPHSIFTQNRPNDVFTTFLSFYFSTGVINLSVSFHEISGGPNFGTKNSRMDFRSGPESGFTSLKRLILILFLIHRDCALKPL